MTTLVLGLFKNPKDAEKALQDLEENGFNPKEISIVMRDRKGSGKVEDSLEDTFIGEGVSTGAAIGSIAGLLVGIAAIIVPGLGGLFVAGPIAGIFGVTATAAATTLSGAIIGGLEGGLVAAFVQLGVPEEEARIYEKGISQGAILLAIPLSGNNEETIQQLLKKHHAMQIQTVNLMETNRNIFLKNQV